MQQESPADRYAAVIPKVAGVCDNGDRVMTTDSAIRPLRQSLVITHWLPTMSANGSHQHWAAHQKKHDIDRDMAWACARQAGWQFVPGRVRLTITLVYSKRPVPDPDNATAKCKGLIDGLADNVRHMPVRSRRGMSMPIKRPGFFTDDSTEYLELVVRALVERGERETRITLEPVE